MILKIGTTVDYKITKLIRFELYGGYNTRRQYHLIDKSDNLHEIDIMGGSFIQFGIALVLPNMKQK